MIYLENATIRVKLYRGKPVRTVFYSNSLFVNLDDVKKIMDKYFFLEPPSDLLTVMVEFDYYLPKDYVCSKLDNHKEKSFHVLGLKRFINGIKP